MNRQWLSFAITMGCYHLAENKPERICQNIPYPDQNQVGGEIWQLQKSKGWTNITQVFCLCQQGLQWEI